MTICGNELSEEQYRQAEDAQKGFFDHHRKSSTEFKSMPGTFGGDGMKEMSDGLKEKSGDLREKSGDVFTTAKGRAKETSGDAVTTFKAIGREEFETQKKVARMFKGLLQRSPLMRLISNGIISFWVQVGVGLCRSWKRPSRPQYAQGSEGTQADKWQNAPKFAASAETELETREAVL
ncbi:hypothetical protein COL922a_005347 [Colletotrichum nupharicola]|nr:hypothetical protein COL922a_005347 [Colletotrichum nupharicola]